MGSFWNGALFGVVATILPSLIFLAVALHRAPDMGTGDLADDVAP